MTQVLPRRTPRAKPYLTLLLMLPALAALWFGWKNWSDVPVGGSVDAVKITHWGVTEAKKTGTGGADGAHAAKKEITRTIADTRELVIFLEELANDVSKENIARVEKKLGEINSAIQKTKSERLTISLANRFPFRVR